MKTFRFDMNSLEDEIDFLADIVFNGFETISNPKQSLNLQYKAKENDDSYTYTFALPGIENKDIKLSYKQIDSINNLIISIENDSDYILKGERQFTLPRNIDIENISAKMKNGIFIITVPKNLKDRKEGTVEVKID